MEEFNTSSTTIIVDVVMTVFSLASIIGSLTVLYLTNKNHHKTIDRLLINVMSVLDTLMGITWLVFNCIKWATNYKIMNKDNILCQIQATMSLGVLEASIDCATFLALLRFIIIVLERKVKRKVYLAVTFTFVLFSISCAIVAGCYNLGEVMPTMSYCEPITLRKIPFTRFYSKWLLTRILLLPVIIIGCYISIAIKYSMLIRKLKNHNCGYYEDGSTSNINATNPDAKILSLPVRSIRRSIIGLIIGSIAYILVFAPSFLSNIIQEITQQDAHLVWLDALTIVSIMSIIIINPFFALFVQEDNGLEISKLSQKFRGWFRF